MNKFFILMALITFSILSTNSKHHKKIIAKNLIRNKLTILEFVERRFGTNPAAAVLRPPIARPLRRF